MSPDYTYFMVFLSGRKEKIDSVISELDLSAFCGYFFKLHVKIFVV